MANARAAQTSWGVRPISDRVELVGAGIARLGEMNDDVVPELARMMGRPIRYGGEFKGVNERASYMTSIAEKAMAPMVVETGEEYDRHIRREPLGVIFVTIRRACQTH